MQINRKQKFLRTKAWKNILWFVSCNFSKFWIFLKDSVCTNIVVDDTCHMMHINILRICSWLHRFFLNFHTVPIYTKFTYVYGYVFFWMDKKIQIPKSITPKHGRKKKILRILQSRVISYLLKTIPSKKFIAIYFVWFSCVANNNNIINLSILNVVSGFLKMDNL